MQLIKAMAFAIIQTGGKQYKVAPGQKLKIEKLADKNGEPVKAGESVSFDQVLLLADGEDVKVGMPTVSDAKVTGKVVKQGHNRTVIVFKYHSKTRYRKKKGHRQLFTEVEITGVK